jgi:hypothetical protein
VASSCVKFGNAQASFTTEITESTDEDKEAISVFSVLSVVNLLFDRAEHEPSLFTEALRV